MPYHTVALTAASEMSAAELAYEAMAAQVHNIVNQAFGERPTDEPLSCFVRWEMLCTALSKAHEALNLMANLRLDDQEAIDDEFMRLTEANDDCNKEAVAQSVGAIMFIYRKAMDRGNA